MLRILGLIFLIFQINVAHAELPKTLKEAFGNYKSVPNNDYFCKNLRALRISQVAENDLLVEVLFDDGRVDENLIPGINTNKVYPVKSISSTVVQRYVFKNKQVKLQEKSSFSGFLSSGFKDRRVLINIIDQRTVEYSYTESSTCTFQR